MAGTLKKRQRTTWRKPTTNGAATTQPHHVSPPACASVLIGRLGLHEIALTAKACCLISRDFDRKRFCEGLLQVTRFPPILSARKGHAAHDKHQHDVADACFLASQAQLGTGTNNYSSPRRAGLAQAMQRGSESHRRMPYNPALHPNIAHIWTASPTSTRN
jgi:hypothetical protein